MSTGKKYTVKFRRKLEKKTNYRKRVKYLSANKPRVVIRTHLNNLLLQLIKFDRKQDKIILSTHSTELKKLGWPYHRGNLPSAYLTGYLFGKKLSKNNIGEVVIDFGIYSPIKKSRSYAALKGLIDAGVKTNHSNEEIFPEESKLHGSHISQYFKKIESSDTNQFSSYKKKSLDMSKIEIVIKEVKNQIGKES
ncbi:50S ribosomal protein L18 [Candidatus Woesearchaeota archaeon]|nr:hypothetical protein [uncultured archaeon]AQS32289.1 hypothetical protein [uncultured archaeon]MBS3149404.1 50S ribosomal protein L18 [Candidatus Woesearchaeota archaeon]